MNSNRPGWKRSLEKGFTVVELLAGVAITLLLVAFTVPTINRASQSYKILTVSREIEAQLHNTRFAAIQRNRSVSFLMKSNSWYFLDVDGSGAINGSEAAMWVPAGGYTLDASTPTTPLTAGVMGMSLDPVALPNGGVAFTNRGTVVQINSTYTPTTTKLSAPGVMYLRDPNGNYAAVTITPAGRIRTWILNENAWR